MPPPIEPFPPSPSLAFVTNAKLDGAIKSAVADLVKGTSGTPPARFALSVVDPANNSVAGFNGDQEHYAASVVKVAGMYAAFALRDMARRYVLAKKPASPRALFQGLRADMDDAIEKSSRVILGLIAAKKHRVPSYESVLSVTQIGGKITVDFQPHYAKSISDMIIPSDNRAAARCVHGVGYSYLNGLMAKHGFFDETNKKGVWFAGDYTGEWSYGRIPCVNDKDTAQGTTTESLARLMTVILFDTVLSHQDHIDMKNMLAKSAHGTDPSFFLRSEVSNRLDPAQVMQAKIGFGPLKSGTTVYSEVCMVRNIGKARHYAVAFANIDYSPYSIDDVLAVLRSAITIYER